MIFDKNKKDFSLFYFYLEKNTSMSDRLNQVNFYSVYFELDLNTWIDNWVRREIKVFAYLCVLSCIEQ